MLTYLQVFRLFFFWCFDSDSVGMLAAGFKQLLHVEDHGGWTDGVELLIATTLND